MLGLKVVTSGSVVVGVEVVVIVEGRRAGRRVRDGGVFLEAVMVEGRRMRDGCVFLVPEDTARGVRE